MAAGMRNIMIMVGMFLLFAVAVGVAGAQRGGEQQGDTRVLTVTEQRPGERGQRGELPEEFTARLAAKLGVSEEALRSAFRETMEELRPAMRERMERGRDRMREWRDRDDGDRDEPRPGRFREGQPGRFPMPGPAAGPGAGGPVPPPVLGLSADILGMEPDALRQEIQAGKTLAQLAQERGVAPDALADQIVGRMEQMRVQQMREMVRGALDHQFGPR